MILACNHIHKEFSAGVIIKDATFHINQQDRVALVGINGAGKTTLLRITMGLTPPDSGELHNIGKSIAAVFQEDRLPNDFTPYVCVKMTAPHGVSKETILSHLAEVGLADCANKPVSQLSGGMRRRVAIIRAVVCNTDTVFFDEPFTGLDRDTKLKTIEYIKRHTQGKTLVFVSHDAEDETLLQARKIRI